MQKKILIATSLWAIGTATSTWACNGSHVLGGATTGAVYTISADTMKKGDFYLGVNVETLQNKSLSDSKIINAIQNGATHLHSIDAVNSYSIAFSYGITDNLTLNTQLPYASRKNIRAGETPPPDVHTHGNVEGMGDISAILQYKVYDDVVKIALLAGLKAPTGKDNLEDEGEVLEADLQPGSGSWDIFTGAAITKNFENFSLHSDILYKYNNTGVDKSQLGDVFTYNTAVSYKLFENNHDHTLHKLEEEKELGYSLSTFLELNGEHAQKDRFHGDNAENTGHNILFATTGLQLVSDAGYSLFFSISKPIYQDFNGLQNDINYKSSFGIGKSF
ncbi:hypothetical protein GJV85_10445 [Sulfurimonas aquatica]|uniref:Transporter n=1 Tax=Sulfurimonas aquatica TaxID=2672570 RepID=A0A975B1H5_9BACT|nr:hypothetical protein [Sulfurimonas aquatica]QSZ42512.1 hypothetical protein GJV85_10445 [Sulfurimonas aquatica]